RDGPPPRPHGPGLPRRVRSRPRRQAHLDGGCRRRGAGGDSGVVSDGPGEGPPAPRASTSRAAARTPRPAQANWQTKLSPVLIIVLVAALAAPAAAVNHPFGSHPFAYAAGSIRPNHVSQSVLDQAVRDFYDVWKTRYVKQT